MSVATEQFIAKFGASLSDATFIRLVLSSPRNPETAPKRALARLVQLKDGLHLSLTLRYATRDITKNLPLKEASDWLRTQIPAHFQSAHLFSTRYDWQLQTTKSGNEKLICHNPSSQTVPPLKHDLHRQSLLNVSANDWLRGLGVVNANGQIRPSMADKYSQINRYLEIFWHLAKDCGWTTDRASDAALSHSERPLTIVDMGCGKGYLTFGVWHLLHRVWRRPAKVIGVESRADLVRAANSLACSIGAEGLEFFVGMIESFLLPNADALIALHACNAATDDVIRRGVELNSQLIIVAPCCHKELRPQMGKPAPLAPVLRHGIMEERMAEWATDGLRALFLEWSGYRVKMIEFVSTEHTPKNLMIAAVRQKQPFSNLAQSKQIEDFKKFFNIKCHTLDPLLEQRTPSPKP